MSFPLPTRWCVNHFWLLAYQCVRGWTLIKPVVWRRWENVALSNFLLHGETLKFAMLPGSHPLMKTPFSQHCKAFLTKSEMILVNHLYQSVKHDISRSHKVVLWLSFNVVIWMCSGFLLLLLKFGLDCIMYCMCENKPKILISWWINAIHHGTTAPPFNKNSPVSQFRSCF